MNNFNLSQPNIDYDFFNNNIKIDNIFKFNNIKLKVVSCNATLNCHKCYFNNYPMDTCNKIHCGADENKIGKNIIFKEIK